MSPEEGRPQEAAQADMSPAAIIQRLQLVGQLNDLCRFLQSGQRPVRQVDPSTQQKLEVVAEPSP
ncbi:MAG: hypothetical protein U0936_09970 [Planctomycetaceae bacterium]